MKSLIDYSNKIDSHKKRKNYNNYLTEFITYHFNNIYNPYIIESYSNLYKQLKQQNFSISQFIKQYDYEYISENCYFLKKEKSNYIIKYTINPQNIDLEYEFLLYNILNKYCTNIYNFPEVPLFFKEITQYKSSNNSKTVIGYIIKLPNLQLNLQSNSSLLEKHFQNKTINNVRSIINIILQLVSFLQLSKNIVNFNHNQFNLKNIFCFDIQSSSSFTKYLKYNLTDFGSIVVRCKYFLIPLSLTNSIINYDFLKELFPDNSDAFKLIDNHISHLDKNHLSLFNKKINYNIEDSYNIITEIFNTIKEDYRLSGTKDEKIILSYLFNWWFNYFNLQNQQNSQYYNLMNNLEEITNNYDILLKFHEVGMFSGKFPSNSKVELYNYEYNGFIIQNRLTNTNIEYSKLNKNKNKEKQSSNKDCEL